MVDFVLGTVPVLGGKRVKAHDADIEFAACLENLDDAMARFTMAKMAREAASLCPTAVPVHDEGHVTAVFG